MSWLARLLGSGGRRAADATTRVSSQSARPEDHNPPKETKTMTKVLVLYYSTYGHTEALAEALAEGARSTGAEVSVKRVPELVADDIARSSRYKLDQKAPIATPAELADYDAIIVGSPTRFGGISAQMENFLDQTGGLWFGGKLVGKVGSAFTSTATQHGGQETTLVALLNILLHHGMIYVGLPYAAQGQMRLDELTGGSPHGVSTIAGPDGSRQVSANELELARFQGRHVAEVAAKQRLPAEAVIAPRD